MFVQTLHIWRLSIGGTINLIVRVTIKYGVDAIWSVQIILSDTVPILSVYISIPVHSSVKVIRHQRGIHFIPFSILFLQVLKHVEHLHHLLRIEVTIGVRLHTEVLRMD